MPLSVLGNPVVRCAALAGACNMATLVGMTIFVPLYFEVVLHLSAEQSGLALIPLMGATVASSTITGRLMMHMVHYKRMPLDRPGGVVAGAGRAVDLAGARCRSALVLLLLLVIGSGLGTLFPISTVCMQNAVTQHQMGVATGAANFFRSLFSALVVAVLGAIVLGGLGGVTGMSVEMLARAASAPELALRVPLRVHALRAGARLRHGVPDRHGRARAQRPARRRRRKRRPARRRRSRRSRRRRDHDRQTGNVR